MDSIDNSMVEMLLQQNKEMKEALKKISNLSSEAVTPLLKAIHKIAFKTLKAL